MAARRLLILLLLLLVVATLASTLVPQPAQREEATSPTDRTASAPDSAGDGRRPGELITKTVDASTRGTERIDLRLGDQLALTVRAGTVDQVEIPALGRLEDVGPDAPARFDLLPPRPGTFEVRLVEARRRVAQIRTRR